MPKHTAVIKSMEPFFDKLSDFGLKVSLGFIKGKKGNSQKRIKVSKIIGGYLLQAKDGSGVQEVRIYQTKNLTMAEVGIIIEQTKKEFEIL